MKQNPIELANKVVSLLDKKTIEKITVDGPGFINITVKNKKIGEIGNFLNKHQDLGFEKYKEKETIVIDYAGMNIAKIMHIGHLRSNIIGQALVNLGRYVGHKVIGDAHLGDWGTPMGVIIALVSTKLPHLEYFDPSFKGDYEKIKFPYSVEELIKLYPIGAALNKEDAAFKEKAQQYLIKLQNKEKGVYAFWKKMREISIHYFKNITDWLNVHLDYWYGESDANDSTKKIAAELKEKGVLKLSEGAMVIQIPQLYKKNETPPFIMYKSNGALKYEATDLGTIIDRVEQFHPNKILYVIDKRQELTMFMVFNAANNVGIYNKDNLEFIGFGTINGKDNKPLKTRDGNASTLQSTIDDTYEAALKIVLKNRAETYSGDEINQIAYYVALSALKFADLSNSFASDYIYEPEKFSQFEGKTGPYILYTGVRIKSILRGNEGYENSEIVVTNEYEKRLIILLDKYADIIHFSFEKRNLSSLCGYIYELTNTFNSFYHNCPVNNANEYVGSFSVTRKINLDVEGRNNVVDIVPDFETKFYSSKDIKNSRLNICSLVLKAIENFANIIGIFIPEKM